MNYCPPSALRRSGGRFLAKVLTIKNLTEWAPPISGGVSLAGSVVARREAGAGCARNLARHPWLGSGGPPIRRHPEAIHCPCIDSPNPSG